MEEISCDAVAYSYTAKRDGKLVSVWEHSGTHLHAHPPGGRMSRLEENSLDDQVLRRPEASAHQLRTGGAAPGSVPLASINPTLANPRVARYEVAKSATRVGLQPVAGSKGGLALLHDLGALPEKLGGRYILESSFSGPTFFTLQTPFMATIIEESVDDWIAQERFGPDAGRHGMVTDGDQSFFRSGTLLATCAFSTTICQWVPVLYTWIDALDTAHHRPHFRHLNLCIIQAAREQFEDRFLTAVSANIILIVTTVQNAPGDI